jgi:hypothetical protein
MHLAAALALERWSSDNGYAYFVLYTSNEKYKIFTNNPKNFSFSIACQGEVMSR